jgi:hypothetical protein
MGKTSGSAKRTMASTPHSIGLSQKPSALRSKPSELMSRPEPLLPLPAVSRRHSKAGLRDLFSKNRSTRTLGAHSELDETPPKSPSSTAAVRSSDASWVPPPLFQAYPQSIKHIKLEASTLSAPAILRLNEQRAATPFQDLEAGSTGASNDTLTTLTRPRRVSASLGKAEWTRKVYVLTTSGHLLQYAGEGAFDRKPEKILQLGRDSAAFACDAIEGRHFVLHVSQSCSDDGEQDLDPSRGIFSRIGIRTASARRSAKVLLMVFQNADDLDSWLSAIRKMIDSLGGRPYSSDTATGDGQVTPQPEISQRYLIRKDPLQFSKETSNSEAGDGAVGGRPSTNSSTYTATDLERLRDSKQSNISAITGTPTSLDDSPPFSPARDGFLLPAAPQLELPDLGPSSLGDLFQLNKRHSRLSLTFSDIMRHKSVDSKPAARAIRHVRKKSSLPDLEQMQEQKQEPPRDDNDETSERPISTIAPLPVFSHITPEKSPNSKHSDAPVGAPLSSNQLPKRFSSLDYSRNLLQSPPTWTIPSHQSTSPKKMRRPNSMQLRAEPLAVPQIPARSPSLRSFGPDCLRPLKIAEETEFNLHQQQIQSQKVTNTPFGPPAGPPPSCPLPTVPPDAVPLRRQSLAARNSIVSERWDEDGPEFF